MTEIIEKLIKGGIITGLVSLMAFAILYPAEEPEERTNNQSAKFTAIDKIRKWGKAETFDSNKVKYASDIFHIAEDSGDSAVIRYAIDALSDISESCMFSSSSSSINNMIVKLGRM